MDEEIYWADKIANKVAEKNKEVYVVASGITPSGTVHIGNFREEMTVDIVRRALESKGVKVKYIHSWDDFDRFRKIPKNVPEEWKRYIGMPVAKVPDPWGCHESYAEHFEKEFEEAAKVVGVNPEYIYENREYSSCRYKDGIKEALNKRGKIIEILNRFRKEPLPNDWYPIQIYCTKCGKDSTKVASYDGDYKIKYKCECGNEEEIDFSKQGVVKLRWRTDWAMRWKFYGVDFEPGGKEHSTPGGSRDTSSIISKEVFNYEPPIYQMYDFVILKGQGGKMSGSLGNVIALKDLNEIYLPEIVRFFYAGTRPNKEFAVPMDDEIFKVYEDFYFTERVYFDKEETDEKRKKHLKRVYEMSVIEMPKELPIQIPFKYIVFLSQIYKKDEDVLEKLKQTGHLKEDMTEFDNKRIKMLIEMARAWAEKYADERYKFQIHEEKHFELSEEEKKAVKMLIGKINSLDENTLYEIGKESGLGKEFFKMCYKILLNKERGPRLFELIENVGREKVKEILEKYL
ncbi:MAG: lysine--tRNA ligase [Nanoarchaeota archaeon]|nr:lysine--tRNA ligase [Nanoarchaeota archaeon]